MSAEFVQLYRAIVSDNHIVYTELRNSNTDVSILLKETVKHSEDTLLHVAANLKRRHIAEIIIDLQPSLLFATNAQGETPLHFAANAGSVDMTRVIIDRCYQIEAVETGETLLRKKTEQEEETALHKAVRNGHLGVVELLIGKDPELTKLVNKDGDSPLFMAVDTRKFQIARTILTVSDCSFKGRKNMNALHAAIAHRSRGIASFLIQKRKAGLIEQQDEELEWTPLHYAAHMNDTESIQLLVSSEHSVASIKDKNGMTALHIAAKKGNVSAVKKLVEICPEICGIVDDKRQSFFHVAVKSRKIRDVRFILGKRYNFLIDLLVYIAFFGLLAVPDFHFESFHRQILSAEFLNMQDYQGNTAFHLAASNQTFFITFLVAMDRRLSKSITNSNGLTVLDILIQSPPSNSLEIRCIFAVLTRGGRPGIKHLLGRKKIEKSEETDDKSWQLREVNFVVSTIIATVAFTAALSVPGGYKNDGPDEGTAALARKTDFRKFFIFNAIAFVLSVSYIFLSRFLPRWKSIFDRLTLLISQLATVAMVFAFSYGTSAVLGSSDADLVGCLKYVTWVFLILIFFASELSLMAEVIIKR